MCPNELISASYRSEPSWVVLSGAQCGLGLDRPAAAFPKELARTIMTRRTRPGDWVLDPFSGWGTSAEVAHEIGRFCLGIELDKTRAAESAASFKRPSVIVNEDSRSSLKGEFPLCQLLITSPPLFLDVSDDKLAMLESINLLCQALLAQRHLLTKTATISIEALVTTSTSGVTRAYHFEIYNAIRQHFRYIGDTIFCCGSGDPLPGGFGHIYMIEFANT